MSQADFAIHTLATICGMGLGAGWLYDAVTHPGFRDWRWRAVTVAVVLAAEALIQHAIWY